MLSSSAVEHYNSVAVQQGYDSLLIEALIQSSHGSQQKEYISQSSPGS